MIFGDLSSWFLVILLESHQNETGKMSPKIMKMRSPKIIKNVSLNMRIFPDIWWFFGDLWWLLVIFHDKIMTSWSWQITIQLGEKSSSFLCIFYVHLLCTSFMYHLCIFGSVTTMLLINTNSVQLFGEIWWTQGEEVPD